MRLTHDISDKWYGEELTYFVENGAYYLCLLGAAETIEFISPKSSEERICYFCYIVSAEFFIREEESQVEKCASITL